MTKAHPPVTPGEILRKDFLEPLGIPQSRLAQAIGLPASLVRSIVGGKTRITAETAVRLSRALGLSERYWLNMQADYDLEVEHENNQAAIDHVEVLVR